MNINPASLLIELGTEELPPGTLDELASAFVHGLSEALSKSGIEAAFDQAKAYCTPRRMAVYIPAVAGRQSGQLIQRRGPALSAGFDANGQPSRALLGFAQSCGVPVGQLDTLKTSKGDWFIYRSVQPGRPLTTLLPAMVEEVLKKLPIQRPMRWADHDYSFVRPVHWLVMLHGDRVIKGEVLGIKSDRQSCGHRFMHPEPVSISDADSWLETLRGAYVLADPIQRRQQVIEEIHRAGLETGGTPRLNNALLDEITHLVEWPVAIACTFERDFLTVPCEVLVTAMQTHQRFVPVFDAHNRLCEYFIGIANIQSKEPARIRQGYERVLRPRFSDARFSWEEDLKTPLINYQEALKKVTYQQTLGSLWDKSLRTAEMARVIAGRVGVDAAAATRAAVLSKCDLLTRMVGEFPQLQGVMGRYYAQHDGEMTEVAEALADYYQPRQAGEAIASGKLARVLVVADRLDTLAGIFAVGIKPYGNRDPFALRRAALGLARTLIEGGFDLDLRALFAETLELLPDTVLVADLKPGKDDKAVMPEPGVRRAQLLDELYTFVLERLRGYYAERGFTSAQFESVRAVSPVSLCDFDRRLRVVVRFSQHPDALALIAMNKRVTNLLRKSQFQSLSQNQSVSVIDPAYFESTLDEALACALDCARQDVAQALHQGQYDQALNRLARLRVPLDAFFEGVMVNVEDDHVRANRLLLLSQLCQQFTLIADISKL